jgi:two-component system OmpR family sensor kinase
VQDRGVRYRRRVRPCGGTRLFERFYRGDFSRTASSAGSWIGLTIARAIVKAHHGQLLAHREGLGQGAQFELTFPVAGHSR